MRHADPGLNQVPIYDYGCQNCGHRFEVIHGVNDSGPSECPVCGGPTRKLLSRPAIVFKGSGWAKKERASSAGRRTKATGESKPDGASQGSSGDKSSGDTGGKDSDKPAGGEASAGD